MEEVSFNDPAERQPPKTFEEAIAREVRNVIVQTIQSGNWLKIPYSGVELPISVLKEAYNRVDMKLVLDQVVLTLQEQMATKIIHAMATELATDIKGIMCNQELREDLRSFLRTKMQESYNAITR